MQADILTIFPGFFRGPLDHGITRRACEMGLVTITVHDLREFTHDKHRTVDDRPFGGGEGMVLKPEPLFECLETLQVVPREDRVAGRVKQSVILLSAQGQRFDQAVAAELAALDHIVLMCGRYEGVDERPNSTCSSGGLLDYPHYTRPAEFRGMAVPEELMSGNHEEIRRWRRQRALEKTLRNRPDLLDGVRLSGEDHKFLARIKKDRG